VATFLKTTQISIDGARTLPRQYYTSPEVFGHELEHIFGKRWLCVGREDRLTNPGDWFTQEVGKESIIVLRDREGGYRAYYNVCRHRGTRICEEHSGQFSGTIQCPYHAWTYGLDGRLIGAPSTADIEYFYKNYWPLFSVPVATW
jgi:Rieske 2Fe-2S family protein